MAKKYGRDISSVTTPVLFHLPDGSSLSFKTSAEALDWFNKNYGDSRYSMEEYVPTEGDAEHPIELLEVVVTGLAPNKSASPTRRGIDMYAGANYSPRFNRAYNSLGMNPFKWPERGGLLAGGRNAGYWDSPTHKAVKEGGDIAAAFTAAPFLAYGAAEYAAPWLAENVLPYMSANGWLLATQATGTTPAWLTPTTATAIDATLASSATGASINDMIQNGPSVGNVAGTALGLGGLAFEAAPAIADAYQSGRRAYNTYRLGRLLTLSARNWDGTVGPEYFRSPDKWYRITSSPEIYGIRELGMNVTTTDLGDMPNSADQFRRFVMEKGLVPGTGENEGYWVWPLRLRDAARNKRIAEESGEARPRKLFDLDENPSLFRKTGSAHGNRSQAAWQAPWEGTTSTTSEFPEYILEGSPLADLTIPYGRRRSFFTSLPIEEVPFGARVGFKTGEMPMEGLRAFRKLPSGRYLYEGPVLPNRTIRLDLTPQVSVDPVASRAWDLAVTLHLNRPFVAAYNQWNRFGYPAVPKGMIFDTPKLESFVRGQLNRHNTFSRGVLVLPQEKASLELLLGRTLSDDEFLRMAATTLRSDGEGQAGLWITPFTNLSSIYGGGRTALVRRPFTLGPDRMKWFEEASFNIQHNPRGGEYTDIMAPWNSTPVLNWSGIPQGVINPGPETELLSPVPMNFVDFVKGSKHMDYRTSRNSNPFFTKGENHFDPESQSWVIDTYKKGGQINEEA